MKQVVSSQDKGWRDSAWKRWGSVDLGRSPPRRWQEGLKSKREREKAAKVIDQFSGNKNSL